VPPLTASQAFAFLRVRAELVGVPLVQDDQLDAARQICRHMDYNPLYIRLASAQLRRRPMAAILAGLGGPDDTRLQWSTAAKFGVEARHRQIHDVIAWSYDLCTPQERLLLDRMSVFAPGCDPDRGQGVDADIGVGADVDAIRAVCA